jgi:hypothetical protein
MSIVDMIRDTLSQTVKLLNQPVVKNGVINAVGVVTFAFGVAEVYDLYETLSSKKITAEGISGNDDWITTAKKISVVMAKFSLILSAAVSRPGVFLISTLMGRIFLPSQLENWFGPYTTFAVYPWHPRHVCSIIAVGLALPSVIQDFYEWTSHKILDLRDVPERPSNNECWLSDSKRRTMILFNTVTSRPTLHLGNQFCGWVIKILS